VQQDATVVALADAQTGMTVVMGGATGEVGATLFAYILKLALDEELAQLHRLLLALDAEHLEQLGGRYEQPVPHPEDGE
jgi:hydrogenase maturation factor